MEIQEHIIQATGLTKDFGPKRVVNRLQLQVEQGRCVGLLGPNGAGKTTTINMILGLVIPTRGSIRVFGKDIALEKKSIKQAIGVAPQIDNLDPDLTVLENLLIYASYYSIPRPKAKERARELLEFFALDTRQEEIIQNLSGGQRRRLIIARALINRPRLLILDEPTIGLDPQARHLIWERLEALKKKGTTMLLTSHYMEEVERLADRVIIMEKGQKILEGAPGELVQEHLGEFVFELHEKDISFETLRNALDGCAASYELHGEKLLIYLKGQCPDLERITLKCKHVVKRPANLEDLFLKYTGRTLVERGQNNNS